MLFISDDGSGAPEIIAVHGSLGALEDFERHQGPGYSVEVGGRLHSGLLGD